MSSAPAKEGEREQVAEAVERLRRAGQLHEMEAARGKCIIVAKADLRTVLSALAEARSEVERLTCSALPADDGLREKVARIIAPHAFSPSGPGRQGPRQDRAHNRDRALHKADAILALLPTSKEPSQ